MIRVEGLSFRHQNAADDVVSNVSFSVPNGSIAVLLGPNGSGKTTLFKLIAGLWNQCAGKVFLDGVETERLSFRERALLLAVVPQEHTPSFPYTVAEAVLMGRAPHVGVYAAPSEKDGQIALETLNDVGIGHLADRPYTKISGGERQLVLIARALAQEAPILLLDEPTSHLDFRNQYSVLSMVRRIAAEKGLTVLMTLHDPNLAAHFAHMVVLLKKGAVAAEGAPAETLTECTLESLYDIGIGVLAGNGRRLVFPKS